MHTYAHINTHKDTRTGTHTVHTHKHSQTTKLTDQLQRRVIRLLKP